MRKLVLALAAAAAFGIAAPAITSTPASAETTIIKQRGHDHDWRRAHNRADKVVIIKKRGHDSWRRAHNRADKTVIIKKRGYSHHMD
jgi:hypothetical protein